MPPWISTLAAAPRVKGRALCYTTRMAQAGFWAISSGKISLRGDGRWYNDEEPINNARIAKLFSKCLRQADDGRWQIAMADERAFVDIQDTPWVVTSVSGDAARGFTVRLNDDSEEALDASSLTVGEANVLYTRVKDGRYRARFLRPAYYQLAPAITERNGRFVLATAGRDHEIRPSKGAD